MTFEEWKEKHSDLIENVAITFFNYERGVDTKTCYDELEYLLRRAFRASKDMNVSTKWHDLRKNPDDLPKPNVAVLILLHFEKRRSPYIAYYRPAFRKWQACNLLEAQRPSKDDDYIDREEVIAWCEIPKFEEE